jgi:hypothetical protein
MQQAGKCRYMVTALIELFKYTVMPMKSKRILVQKAPLVFSALVYF